MVRKSRKKYKKTRKKIKKKEKIEKKQENNKSKDIIQFADIYLNLIF